MKIKEETRVKSSIKALVCIGLRHHDLKVQQGVVKTTAGMYNSIARHNRRRLMD
jgi:hypothetical protein